MRAPSTAGLLHTVSHFPRNLLKWGGKWGGRGSDKEMLHISFSSWKDHPSFSNFPELKECYFLCVTTETSSNTVSSPPSPLIFFLSLAAP